ncbi:MAG: hypothetical protein E3J78_01705 [Candidatus Cloacimonadota bacterium]|nr:MAG: hypothetical protein E3J78_01705 [Candidatus Cloacimonadota bacterium]
MNFRIWFALALIVLGVLFWLGKFGIIDFYWDRDWPVILIAIGVFSFVNIMVKKSKRGRKSKKTAILNKLNDGDIDAEEAISKIKDL